MPDVKVLRRASVLGSASPSTAIEQVGLQEQQLCVALAFWATLISHEHTGRIRLAICGAASAQLLASPGPLPALARTFGAPPTQPPA